MNDAAEARGTAPYRSRDPILAHRPPKVKGGDVRPVQRCLLVFLTRRTADPEIAFDLWSETFAQAVVSKRRYRGSSEAEAGAWLYGIARNQLMHYYRRGRSAQRCDAASARPEPLGRRG